MKYIDAEKLIKSLNNYQDGAETALNPIDGNADYYKGKIDACKDIQEFITSLQQEQPLLPSNLDDAAEEYANIQNKNFLRPEIVKNIFKTGAEWMMRQGYTFETIMQEDDVDELVPTCPDMYNHGYSGGDKVIVQIRKKQ